MRDGIVLPAKYLACVLRLPSEGSSTAGCSNTACDAALKNWYCGDYCLNFEPTEMEHISLIEAEWMLDTGFIFKKILK